MPDGTPTRDVDRPVALVVPDSFKGTFTSTAVAGLLARGLERSGCGAIVVPMADGGEGTTAAIHTALGGDLVELEVAGLLPHQRVLGSVLILPDRGLAFIDAASASGLTLVPEAARDPWEATSRGTGELIMAAVRRGVRQIWLGVGGSGCTDGGLGAIEAIREGGGLGGTSLTVMCDVRTPFEAAPAVFGPQKGASPAMVAALERRLDALAVAYPRDPRGVGMTGAAGGLAGGLWACFGAELTPGVEAVLRLLSVHDRLKQVDFVVSGEGRLDRQTAHGKVIAGVVAMGAGAGLPVHAVVGSTDLTPAESVQLGLASVQVASSADEIVDAGARILALSRPS